MLTIVIVSNKPLDKIRTIETLDCPVPHRLIVSRAFGFGCARNVGASCAGGLMVQLNDDLIIDSSLWTFVESVKAGEFAFQVVHNAKAGDQPCSRVLVIHAFDYWRVGGCDNSLKYFFEDGDFYHRALATGLSFRQVPDACAAHIPHRHAFYDNKARGFAVTSEVCRVYVKYGRRVTCDVFSFFVPFRDYRVVLQHLVLRVGFMVYWIIRGAK